MGRCGLPARVRPEQLGAGGRIGAIAGLSWIQLMMAGALRLAGACGFGEE